MDVIPDFFIIGAAKCGTTSLHFYLDEHPEIEMASFKEPEVLSEPTRVPGRSDWSGLFSDPSALHGESSTAYSRFPSDGDAAARMREVAPDAKLIYLVRDPIERIISDYVHHFANGTEPGSIEDALRDVEDRSNFFVSASRYGTQIENYLRYFDPEQLLVLEQWALRHRQEETMRRVLTFLEVDPEFESPSLGLEFLNRRDLRPNERLLPILRRSPLRQVWRLLPLRARLPVTRAVFRGREAERPELSDELRARLLSHLLPEMELLRRLTGEPFEHLP